MATDAINYCRQRIRDAQETIENLSYCLKLLHQDLETSEQAWNDARGRLIRENLRTTTEGGAAQLRSSRNTVAASENVLGPLTTAADDERVLDAEVTRGILAEKTTRGFVADAGRAADMAQTDVAAAQSRSAQAQTMLARL